MAMEGLRSCNRRVGAISIAFSSDHEDRLGNTEGLEGEMYSHH